MNRTRKPLEPNIDRNEDFEPRLPSTLRRERGGILGSLRSLQRLTTRGGLRRGRRVATGRGRLRAQRSFKQRVIFKARVVTGKGQAAVRKMRAHLRYLSRSGASLGAEGSEFFGKYGEYSRADLSRQASEWQNDEHHFRFIISPERGAELDLVDYVRNVLNTMERDLKTTLQWYAVCHYNTDNPHAHVVVRGVDEHGKALMIDRDYLSHGIRHILEHEATIRLGERDLGTIQQSIERSIFEERFTFIDKQLLSEQRRSRQQCVHLKTLRAAAREWEKTARHNRIRRLAFLETKGLAEEVATGVWKIHDDAEQILRDLAFTRRVEALVAPHLEGTEARKQQLVIHRETEPLKTAVLGYVVAKDLIDELHDKRFVLLDGSDGRTHFIPLGRFSEPSGFECRAGQIVTVAPPDEPKVRAEEVILSFLNNRGGEFSIKRFSAHVSQEYKANRWRIPSGMTIENYVELFTTRCETLSRAGILQPKAPGAWEVPIDVVQRAKSFDDGNKKQLRTSVKPHTFRPLLEEIATHGASWLDLLIGETQEKPRLQGSLALEVQRALVRRAEILRERKVPLNRDTFKVLLAREEQQLINRLEQRFGTRQGLQAGQEVSGTVVGYELLGDGYRMVVKLQRGFVLRKVARKEAQLAFGTEVSLCRARKGATGGRETSDFITVKAKGPGHRQGQSRNKG